MSAGWPAQLTVSACNRLGQYSSSPGTWSYCYTELAVSRRSWSQCSSRLYPQADNSQLRHWSRGLLINYSHDNIRLMSQTSLPSNLRPTTRECVRLVMRHFRSRDKDSGSAIPSAVSESLNAASKLHGCTFYRTRVIALHCGIAIFDPILLLRS